MDEEEIPCKSADMDEEENSDSESIEHRQRQSEIPSDVDFIISHFFSRLETQSAGHVENEIAEMWPWPNVSTDPQDQSMFEPVRRIAYSGMPVVPPRRFYRRCWKGLVRRLLRRAAENLSVPTSEVGEDIK
jgi:hypothetical protein